MKPIIIECFPAFVEFQGPSKITVNQLSDCAIFILDHNLNIPRAESNKNPLSATIKLMDRNDKLMFKLKFK